MATDERWEKVRGATRKETVGDDVHRGGGMGHDTRSILTIYVPTLMANGNYICFNYWWPHQLSSWGSPLGTKQLDICIPLLLFMYAVKVHVHRYRIISLNWFTFCPSLHWHRGQCHCRTHQPDTTMANSYIFVWYFSLFFSFCCQSCL